MTIEQRAQDFLAALNAHPNIFTDVLEDRLLADARAADARQERGTPLSPLDGQFLAVKANIDIQGLRSHSGSRLYRPEPAQSDAPIVARMRAAGLIVIGHTNMSEFAFSGLGLNPHFGTPPNALRQDLVPGGSSSGSATAVALGLADLALGTDTSGSVRIPAACQGIIGFRPSIGRYDDIGIFPLAPSLDTPGPLARRVESIRSLDSLLTRDRNPGQNCKRIICLDEKSLDDYAPEIGAMYRIVVEQLADTEFDLEVRTIHSFARVNDLFHTHGTLVGAEAYRLLKNVVQADHIALDPRVRDRLSHSATISDENMRTLLAARRMMIETFEAELQGGMLLYPTLPSPPPSIQDVIGDPTIFARENAHILSVSMKAAFLNAPTITLPVGSGVPGCSLSLTSSTGADKDLLTTAVRLEPIFRAICDR
ncbi:amidase family protein [Roseobacter sp. MED193]|uniref:amidase family protein n=1 Tax=Roseobacter sp. MED193 TaxID=314262 RepID=UPI000068B82E|nr:amidase family protein [Roseobacter sp. MED193]EAQ47190.1 amidase family protein [Roseobacter sp. MED193]